MIKSIKKILVLFICVLCVTGCNKKEVITEDEMTKIVEEKVNEKLEEEQSDRKLKSIKKNDYSNSLSRSESNNYGVNKKWSVTINNKKDVLETPYVDIKHKIYDYSDVLTNEEEELLRDQIKEFEKKYNTSLVIVIYNLPYSNDRENEDFAANFYDYNDFGINYDLYNGVLLFRNTYELDPYYNIYTFGHAQLYFNNSAYDKILDGIYDDLYSGNYYDGFSMFITAVTSKFNAGIPRDMEDYKLNSNGVMIYSPSEIGE